MVDQTLVKYIQDSLSRNVPIGEIKRILLEKGWQELAINDAINSVNPQMQPKPIQPQPLTQPMQTQQQPIIRPQTLPQQLPGQQQPQKAAAEKKPFKPNIILIASISAGALILVIILLLIFMPKGNISNDQLSQGTSVNLKEDKEIKFSLNAEDHRILVNSINSNSVDFTIYSTPINASLKIGETKKFDIDSNDFYDLSVKLNGITNNEADLFVKKINEAVCTEDWDCGNWSACKNLSQTRNCADANDCGTEKSKPIEIQECIDLSCSGQGGKICSQNQNCSAIAINASDGICCLGNCTTILINNTNASLPLGTIVCDDIDCMIDASENCSKSNLTIYSFSSSNSTWIQNINYTYRIDGFDSADKCKFYSRIKKISGNFTDSYWTTLLDTPYTVEQINQMIDGIESDLNGKSGTCKFPQTNLTNYLTKIKEENYELSDGEITAYNCTGNLYP